MTPESGIAPEIGGIDEPVVCFGEFRLDLRRRSLHRGADAVKLTPKPFATLAFLVENRQRVVSKAELLETIWGGAREVSTVEHAVGRIRVALGDDAEESRYVQTVPGQGYRFVAEVQPAAVKTASVVRDATAHRRTFRPPWVAVAALACLGAIGAAIAYFVIPSRVSRVAWNGKTLVAMSDSGRVLWRHPLEATLRDPPAEELVWRTQIVDLNGGGDPEVLVAAAFGGPGTGGKDEILCLSSQGKLLWRYKPDRVGIEFNRGGLDGPWKFADMLVVPEGQSSSVWVAVVHDVWWPSFIERLSPAGVRSRVFTSSGDIMALRRVRTTAGAYMLAAGINNEYRQASLAILSENGPPTTSPQTEGSEFQCVRGCPAAKPYRYILLPRSELNTAADAPYNTAIDILARPGGITVKTQELATGSGAFFDFSQDLQPERVAFDSGYREVHQRFEREGRIKHSYKDCPERKSPAILTICDEHGNKSTVKVPRVPTPD
jgi:DNA-binding winged helix-turn-helix (wHTH) protein